MSHKVGNSTSAPPAATPAAQQTEDVNPFRTAPVPQRKGDDVDTARSEKGAKQHATQNKEHKKLEGSVRQAEMQQDYDNWFNDTEKHQVKDKRLDDPRFNEDAERTNTKKAGRLVKFTNGPYSHEQPGRPMTVTVHGINASPEAVRPLSARAEKAGDKVSTFMYDDNYKRLSKSSEDLANSLEKQLSANPGRPLRIDAHSMGGRIAMQALDILEKRGSLRGHQVELNLIASPINGIGAANAAAWAMGPMSGIKNVPSGKDMGTNSRFQKHLNDITFGSNVKVRIFTGGKDDVVNRDESFNAMAKQLKAERVHLPNATHDSAVDEAAVWLARHDH
jgi:pimeloyl-ACP methyl ester carboxylesterase